MTDEAAGAPRGGAFYDDADVFARYREPRAGVSDPTAVMEHPALLAELGDVGGLRIVDLGCGEARIGRELLAAGCRRYVGVDGSANMVRAARATLAATAGEVAHQDIEDFRAEPDTFDLVISRLALHYVADLDPVLRACAACLTPGGRVVFTVVHPVITSHDARPTTEQPRASWVVDDYFATGSREQAWLGGTVAWHHRTVADHVAALRRSGFTLTGLSECPPRAELLPDPAELARRRRIPLFLLLAGTRA